MPIQIIKQDITKVQCDAIVNPTDFLFSGSGGTDYAVHKAAGSELDIACRELEPLSVGRIAVTNGYRLPCRYVFHTVGPIWNNGQDNEGTLLRSCYLNALLAGNKLKLSSIAFPLISSGSFGFPKDRVLQIATEAISDFLNTVDTEPEVFLCIYDRHAYALSRETELAEYLHGRNRPFHPEAMLSAAVCEDSVLLEECSSSSIRPTKKAGIRSRQAIPVDLSQWIRKQDDSFAVTLLKLIDRKGMTEVECYKKANVSKGTFWKINNDPAYRPSKTTVLAFAIALCLTLDETQQLLKTAGFTLSQSNTFDMIIQFYILNGNYDIYEINAALFQYDQVCLGC